MIRGENLPETKVDRENSSEASFGHLQVLFGSLLRQNRYRLDKTKSTAVVNWSYQDDKLGKSDS